MKQPTQFLEKRGHGRSPRPGNNAIPKKPQANRVSDNFVETLELPEGPDRVNSQYAPGLLGRASSGSYGRSR